MATCQTVLYGLPASCKKGNLRKAFAGLIFVREGTTVAIADAETKATWDTLAINGTALPMGRRADEIEDATSEGNVYQSPFGNKKRTTDDLLGYMMKFDLNDDEHKTVESWEGAALDVFVIDYSGRVIGVNVDGTNMKGFAVGYMDVKNNVVTPDGPALTTIEIQHEDFLEFSEQIVSFNPLDQTTAANRWNAFQLKGVSFVTLTTGTAVAGTFTMIVKSISASYVKDGAFNELAIDGLDVSTFTNFIFLNSSKAAVPPDSMTDNGDGTYTVVEAGATIVSAQVIPTADNKFQSEIVAVTT